MVEARGWEQRLFRQGQEEAGQRQPASKEPSISEASLVRNKQAGKLQADFAINRLHPCARARAHAPASREGDAPVGTARARRLPLNKARRKSDITSCDTITLAEAAQDLT